MQTSLRNVLATGILILAANHSLAAQQVEDSWAEGANTVYRETMPSDSAALRQRASSGDLAAQNDLGFLYANGKGVPKDLSEAVRWYRKAADQGYADAQNNLGVLYNYGQGVPHDCAEAIVWYRKAAEQGDVKGQYNMGQLYRHGCGVERDDGEASIWYRKAADQDYADAQYNFGLMYKNGIAVPRDNVRAYMWLDLAAAKKIGGNQKKFIASRDALGAVMTPEQVTRAQKLARDWVPGSE
ncbi:MAG: tetratricopeptide repeat protein [Acidobacteriota bacterium]